MRLYLALFIWSLSACCLAEPMHAFKAVHADGTIGSGNTFEQGNHIGQDGGFWYFRLRADFD